MDFSETFKVNEDLVNRSVDRVVDIGEEGWVLYLVSDRQRWLTVTIHQFMDFSESLKEDEDLVDWSVDRMVGIGDEGWVNLSSANNWCLSGKVYQ